MIALVVKTTRVIVTTSMYGAKRLIAFTGNRRQHKRFLAFRKITSALHLSHL